ncbi:unnamed protein product [Symbiodinium sp. CCMP2592]|nr:unnamed protein product [Symbiodinium sp. CCMP2592]
MTEVPEPICYRCGYPWSGHAENLGPYNKWCLRRWAAGVVVLFTDSDTGDPFLLFGKEKRLDGGYNAFWGFGELHEKDPHQTAAREACEEALGILGNQKEILASIEGQESADAEVFLFLLSIGAQQVSALVDRYHERRQLWISAAESLKSLTQPGLRPGGDIMDALFAVPAQEFLAACWQLQDRRGKGGAAVSLHSMSGGVFMPKVEAKGSKKGASASGGLRPRPPAVCLAKLLARPQTDTAVKLQRFCSKGLLLPPHVPKAACVPGITRGGLPDGSMLAVQAIFSATWTGPCGTGLACTAESLADACATFLRRLEPPDVKLYFAAWIERAMDSPQQAKLAASHIARLVQRVPVVPLLQEQVTQTIGDACQRVDAALSTRGDSSGTDHGKIDHESLTSCYQLLSGASFVNELMKVGGINASMQPVLVEKARQHIEATASRHRLAWPAWLPSAAMHLEFGRLGAGKLENNFGPARA